MSEIVVVITGATGPSGSGGSIDLDDLTDVTITAAASGDILRHNGAAWVDAVGTTHFEAAGAVAAHEADTTNVHGIADTSVLVTNSSLTTSLSSYVTSAAAPELIRDTIGTALTAGTGITVTPNDGADTITVATTITQYTDEMARDALGTALVAGTNMTVTVNDAGDTITLAASGGDITTATVWAAKGDLIAATGNDAAAVVTVGANGRALIADSAQSAGVRWGAANPGPHTGYVTGSYYTPGRSGAANTTASWGLNQLWFVPFFVTTTTTFDQMQIYQSATGNVRLGIYAADGTAGAPGTLVLDAGVITGVGGGDKTLSISQSLTGGTWYYLALVSDTTLTFGTIAAASLNPITSASPATGTVNYAYFRSFTYGALPAPAGSLSVTSSAPCILLRAA